ncbi:MAG: hypothetical protein QM589_03870 [Thermomicrobiales bacterium]
MRRSRPFVFLGIFVAVIVGLFALGTIFGDGDWGPRHDENRVTIVNPGQGGTVDGQPVQSGGVVVIDNGRRGPGFFPFFPLVPLFFFGLVIFGFVCFGRRFRRGWGGPGCGPGGWGGPDGGPSRFAGEPPAWFDSWHEQAHRQQAETASPESPAVKTDPPASTTEADDTAGPAQA